MGQLNVQAYRFAPRVERPLVGRLHYAGAAAGNDAEARLHQQPGYFLSILIFLHILGAAGGAEQRNAVDLQGIECIQGLHHLGHDAEGTPGFGGNGSKIVHNILLQFRHSGSFI